MWIRGGEKKTDQTQVIALEGGAINKNEVLRV